MSGPAPVAAGTPLNLEKLSALLVDDNAQALDILAQVVTGFGVRNITRCDSGDAAQGELRRATFDLIVADVHMPGLDGYELVEWLRREGPQPNRFAPVLLVTGHTRQSEVLRARDCGANFIVAKPLTPKVVLERIVWVAREDRMFIEAEGYVGPDRRFKRLGPPAGMDGRRADDLPAEVGDAQEQNLSEDEIAAMLKPMKVAI